MNTTSLALKGAEMDRLFSGDTQTILIPCQPPSDWGVDVMVEPRWGEQGWGVPLGGESDPWCWAPAAPGQRVAIKEGYLTRPAGTAPASLQRLPHRRSPDGKLDLWYRRDLYGHRLGFPNPQYLPDWAVRRWATAGTVTLRLYRYEPHWAIELTPAEQTTNRGAPE